MEFLGILANYILKFMHINLFCPTVLHLCNQKINWYLNKYMYIKTIYCSRRYYISLSVTFLNGLAIKYKWY